MPADIFRDQRFFVVFFCLCWYLQFLVKLRTQVSHEVIHLFMFDEIETHCKRLVKGRQ